MAKQIDWTRASRPARQTTAQTGTPPPVPRLSSVGRAGPLPEIDMDGQPVVLPDNATFEPPPQDTRPVGLSFGGQFAGTVQKPDMAESAPPPRPEEPVAPESPPQPENPDDPEPATTADAPQPDAPEPLADPSEPAPVADAPEPPDATPVDDAGPADEPDTTPLPDDDDPLTVATPDEAAEPDAIADAPDDEYDAERTQTLADQWTAPPPLIDHPEVTPTPQQQAGRQRLEAQREQGRQRLLEQRTAGRQRLKTRREQEPQPLETAPPETPAPVEQDAQAVAEPPLDPDVAQAITDLVPDDEPLQRTMLDNARQFIKSGEKSKDDILQEVGRLSDAQAQADPWAGDEGREGEQADETPQTDDAVKRAVQEVLSDPDWMDAVAERVTQKLMAM